MNLEPIKKYAPWGVGAIVVLFIGTRIAKAGKSTTVTESQAAPVVTSGNPIPSIIGSGVYSSGDGGGLSGSLGSIDTSGDISQLTTGMSAGEIELGKYSIDSQTKIALGQQEVDKTLGIGSQGVALAGIQAAVDTTKITTAATVHASDNQLITEWLNSPLGQQAARAGLVGIGMNRDGDGNLTQVGGLGKNAVRDTTAPTAAASIVDQSNASVTVAQNQVKVSKILAPPKTQKTTKKDKK